MNFALAGIPIVEVGPGSQPQEEDGAVLDYMPMPQAMDCYHTAVLPEEDSLQNNPYVLSVLAQLQQRLDARVAGDSPPRFLNLTAVTVAEKHLLAQILAEGEVSVLFDSGDGGHIEIQETSLPGIWWHRVLNAEKQCQHESLEIGMIPQLVMDESFAQAWPDVPMPTTEQLAENTSNAPWLLAELQEKVQQKDYGHVINLSLLPLSNTDLELVSQQLGVGKTAILSRGYGNCRITATAVEDVWWVQYFNSIDTLILNSLEVVEVPQVACASQEDLQDSAQRLREIREALQ